MLLIEYPDETIVVGLKRTTLFSSAATNDVFLSRPKMARTTEVKECAGWSWQDE